MLCHYDGYLRFLETAGFDRRRARDLVGAVVGHALGYSLLSVSYFGSLPSPDGDEREIQRIRRVTRSLPDDLPGPLLELAVELIMRPTTATAS